MPNNLNIMNINIFLDVEWQYPSTKLRGATPLMTVIFTNTAARTIYVTSPDTVNGDIWFLDSSQKIKHSPYTSSCTKCKASIS
jgi:hypothetical protein